ncbi:MAG: HPP family protein [Synergistaceae bacterium]|jgi:CBS-domain-containing membrane protein|nr:HPP family protein [Synergistaceae bacterium]
MGGFWNNIGKRLRIYAGIALSFGIVSFISDLRNVPLLIAPLAASACILFAVPDSPVARAKNIIFGHVISASVGVIMHGSFGSNWLSNVICVVIAVFLMDAAGVLHPPAAATSLLALTTSQGFSFVFMPVGTGALALVAASMAAKRVIGCCFPNRHEPPE